MDEYMQNSKVDDVLRRCAFRLAAAGGEQDAGRAVLLYQLAGSYAEAVNELCKQLASHLTPSASRGSAASVWAGHLTIYDF